MEYKKLDLTVPEITEALQRAFVFAKKGVVMARKAVPGETIKTILADGSHETTNTAGEDSYVLTNPDGERYIIGSEKFMTRYTPTTVDGVFKAKGLIRAIRNPAGQPIEIQAPWGETQRGNSECMVATVYDPYKPDEVGSDRYIIGAPEFQNTYSLRP